MEITTLQETADRLRDQIGRVVRGQDEVMDHILCALLCRGHVLLEGVPGTAKTLLARCVAASLDLAFSRIQFTPDLMPGDVLGTNIFDFQSGRFQLTQGPIFTDLLLADEINRTPPKTQAALLEAMQEQAVTLDGRRHDLGENFLVVATQNPIEQEGTYPLPEAQLDRFLFKLLVDYPGRDHELELVRLHGHGTTTADPTTLGLVPLVDKAWLADARGLVATIHVEEDCLAYLVDVVRATRSHPSLLCGASPRAAVMLTAASRSWAALRGRDFVTPDDIKEIAPALLRHRLPIAPGAELEGADAERIVAGVLEQVPAPR
ncbi:MAG: MoxR family ATPase [Candidatus Krumholzibacteriia bacterium]